jgi:hypothetical protein
MLPLLVELLPTIRSAKFSRGQQVDKYLSQLYSRVVRKQCFLAEFSHALDRTAENLNQPICGERG